MTWTLAAPLRRVWGGQTRARPIPAPPPPPAAPATPTSDPGPHVAPKLKDWLGVLAMVCGQFMAIMDVQIVTSSLTQIQGGLSASPDEISWVQTAYLIADVVMVPLSGTLSRLFSTRVVFACAAAGFTGASVLCATATNLDQMILYRALQGACGGSLTPLVFPVIYTKFRQPQLGQIMVLISLILNLSSTLGPTVGGYLTDTLNWHWLFLVNVAPGLLVIVTVWFMIDIDKPDLSLMRNLDFMGLVFMAIFLASLEYALEEGPRWDWLDDRTIRYAVVAVAIFSPLFFWRVLTYSQPIVELRTFKDRNFALGTFYTFVIGTGLYGATYVIPLFLAQVRGYSAFQIGMIVVVTGVTQMCMTPFTAYISRKLDLRVMLGIGMGLFAVSMYLTATLTNQASFNELMVPQIVRGVALMFCYLPANLISLSTLGPDRLKNGAGLYNLTRDLGGAIALATIGTIMNDRLHFHWNRLIEDVNPARPVVQHFLSASADRLSNLIPGDPHQAAVRLLAAQVQREALVLTFNDVILMMGVLFVVGVMLMPLVRNRRSFMAR